MRPTVTTPVVVAAMILATAAPAIAANSPRPRLSLPTAKTSVAAPITATVRLPGGQRSVRIQTRSQTSTWQTVANGRTYPSGTAKIRFTTYQDGKYQVRAVAGGVNSARQSLKATYPTAAPPRESLAPMRAGALRIANAATGSVTAGDYTVAVTGSGVRITDSAGRTAWASRAGTPFLIASRSTLRWFQRSTAGAFWAQVQRRTSLTDQRVTAVRTSGDTVTLVGTLRGDGKSARYTMVLQPSGAALQMRVTFADNSQVSPNSVQVISERASSAGVHGFGNQYQDFDLSGQLLPILVQEQGVTRGEEPAAKLVDAATWGAGTLQTTYGGWPTYVTDQNRSFSLVDNRASGALAVADMRKSRLIGLESFAPTFTATIQAADSPAGIVRARGAATTRPPLAGWVQNGAVLGLQGGTAKVRQVVADMQAAGTKISAVWLQDWVGKRVTTFGEQLWWTWQLNRATYPDWEQMVADFNAQGIKVMTYVNPFVINQSQVNGQPIENFYAQGEQKGFLVKNQRGGTYVVQTIGFPTALVDLTNPDARDWFADIIAKQVLGVGASGFMADFGEYLPMDSVLFKGKAARQHSRWPQLWAQTVRQACTQAGVPDCLSFFRSSYLGSPRNVPLMWAGDQMVNYAREDGMRNAVLGMLAGGVSGAPLWHSDIGGYTSVNAAVTNFLRPPQLNARWAEMQAFGVVMRTHETNRPTLNQQVYDTPETRAQFARASQIYAALHDYRASVIDEAVRTGMPAMRHGWLVYPGTDAATADEQFFLGDHLLVAPVYAENATGVDVVFPPGQWRHVLTGEVYSGQATVPAPIGTPAGFVLVGDPVGDQILTQLRAAGL